MEGSRSCHQACGNRHTGQTQFRDRSRCRHDVASARKSGCLIPIAARIPSYPPDQAETHRPRASRAYPEGTGHPEETETGTAVAAEPAHDRWGSLRFRAPRPAGTWRPTEIVPIGEPQPVRIPIDPNAASGWSRSSPKSDRLHWLRWSPDRREPAMLSVSPPARS